MIMVGSERLGQRQPGRDLRYSKRAARDAGSQNLSRLMESQM
jgi:hypothetical protein